MEDLPASIKKAVKLAQDLPAFAKWYSTGEVTHRLIHAHPNTDWARNYPLLVPDADLDEFISLVKPWCFGSSWTQASTSHRPTDQPQLMVDEKGTENFAMFFDFDLEPEADWKQHAAELSLHHAFESFNTRDGAPVIFHIWAKDSGVGSYHCVARWADGSPLVVNARYMTKTFAGVEGIDLAVYRNVGMRWPFMAKLTPLLNGSKSRAEVINDNAHGTYKYYCKFDTTADWSFDYVDTDVWKPETDYGLVLKAAVIRTASDHQLTQLQLEDDEDRQIELNDPYYEIVPEAMWPHTYTTFDYDNKEELGFEDWVASAVELHAEQYCREHQGDTNGHFPLTVDVHRVDEYLDQLVELLERVWKFVIYGSQAQIAVKTMAQFEGKADRCKYRLFRLKEFKDACPALAQFRVRDINADEKDLKKVKFKHLCDVFLASTTKTTYGDVTRRARTVNDKRFNQFTGLAWHPRQGIDLARNEADNVFEYITMVVELLTALTSAPYPGNKPIDNVLLAKNQFTWLWNSLVFHAQRPCEKLQWATIFYSAERGVGKTNFLDMLQDLFGVQNMVKTSQGDEFFGQFNYALAESTLVGIEEWNVEGLTNSEKTKKMQEMVAQITTVLTRTQRKFKDTITEQTQVTFYMGTNFGLPFAYNQRRFLVIEASRRLQNRSKWFAKFDTFVKAGYNAALLAFLQSRTLDPCFHPHLTPPQTPRAQTMGRKALDALLMKLMDWSDKGNGLNIELHKTTLNIENRDLNPALWAWHLTDEKSGNWGRLVDLAWLAGETHTTVPRLLERLKVIFEPGMAKPPTSGESFVSNFVVKGTVPEWNGQIHVIGGESMDDYLPQHFPSTKSVITHNNDNTQYFYPNMCLLPDHENFVLQLNKHLAVNPTHWPNFKELDLETELRDFISKCVVIDQPGNGDVQLVGLQDPWDAEDGMEVDSDDSLMQHESSYSEL